MAIYKIDKDTGLQIIKDKRFKLEKEIQSLVEKNLLVLMGLTFIRSEFALSNFRIDTLAFDDEKKSFVIIEYKRDKNFSVIDQGYAYLSLMLNNKADFILEYNESKFSSLKRSDIDWSQSKVIFVSPSFTTYQKEAINFKDLPIELWEIRRYESNTLLFDKVLSHSSNESIKTISNNETVNAVSQEIVVYSEQEHLSFANDYVKEIYIQLRDRILALSDDIALYAKKKTIGFKVGYNIFCDMVVQNKCVKLFLNMKSGELKDPEHIARDVSNVGHWGNGAYEIKLINADDIDYIVSLLKQSVIRNQK